MHAQQCRAAGHALIAANSGAANPGAVIVRYTTRGYAASAPAGERYRAARA